MALALVLVLRTCPGGLLFLAPVCSSWVFMCLGTSRRNRYDSLGNTDLRFVRDANKMVSRCAILILLATALGIYWILEQPLSSLMIFHPRLQDIVTLMRVWQVSFKMSQFGARSEKPTKLYSNAEWVSDIANAESCVDDLNCDLDSLETYVKYFDKDGHPKVKGGRDLKLTQEYPRKIGVEVRRAWRNRARRDVSAHPFSAQQPDALSGLLKLVAGDGGVFFLNVINLVTHGLRE